MKKIALILFLALLFFSPGRLTSWDAGIRLDICRALWQTGSVFVPRDATNKDHLTPSPHDPSLGTSFYGIGQTLLFIPFDIVGYAAGKLVQSPSIKPQWVASLALVFLYAPLMGILLWFGMFGLLQRLDYSRRISQLGSSLILFGTTALIYTVGITQEEIPIAVLLCWGLCFSLDYVSTRKRRPLFFSAACWGATFLFRLNVIFALLPLLGLVADKVRTQRGATRLPWKTILTTVGLGLLPPFLLYVGFSHWRYGGWLTTGYALMPNMIFLRPVQLPLALGLFLGPGKGFITLSPLLLLAIEGLRREKQRYFFFNLGLFTAFFVSSLVYSRLAGSAFPDGSESWGNRFQLHLIFLFAIGLAAFVERCRFTLTAKLLVTVSILFQVLATCVPDSLDAFHYAGESDTQRKTRLLLGADDGQLGQRLKSVAYSLTGKYPRIWVNTENKRKITEVYIPNYWGPVFYKKLGGGAGGLLSLLVWLALLPLAVGLTYVFNGRTFSFHGRSVP